MASSTSPKSAFAGQLAVVTGGASGIGRALSAALRAEGARVVLLDVDEPRLRAAADALACRGELLDVRDAAAVEAAVAAIEARDGPIDLFINNAGLCQTGEAHRFTRGDWSRLLDVNIRGVVNGVQAVYPRMVARGRGCILNIGSIAGLFPTAGQVSYVTSKFAVVGLSQALRAEGADYGVKVSVACPGIIDTPMRRGLSAVGVDDDSLRALIPAGLQVERCARAILRGLARDQALILVGYEAHVLSRLQRVSPALGGWLNARAIRWLRGRLGVARPTGYVPSS